MLRHKCIINVDSNDKLKEIDIKNRMGYYFDDIIKIDDLNLDDVSIDEKWNKNILIYNISHKSLIGNRLRIIFHK